MKTIKTIADLAAVLAVYPQNLPLAFTVDRAPAELATDMQIHQIHRPSAHSTHDVLQIALMAEDRRILQADGQHPAPCARFCEATAFKYEIKRMTNEGDQLKTAKAELYHALGLSAAALRRALATTPHDDKFYGLTDKTEQNCRAVMAKHKKSAGL